MQARYTRIPRHAGTILEDSETCRHDTRGFRDMQARYTRIPRHAGTILEGSETCRHDTGGFQDMQARYWRIPRHAGTILEDSNAVPSDSQQGGFCNTSLSVSQWCLLLPILFNWFFDESRKHSMTTTHLSLCVAGPNAAYDLPTTSIIWAASLRSSRHQQQTRRRINVIWNESQRRK